MSKALPSENEFVRRMIDKTSKEISCRDCGMFLDVLTSAYREFLKILEERGIEK